MPRHPRASTWPAFRTANAEKNIIPLKRTSPEANSKVARPKKCRANTDQELDNCDESEGGDGRMFACPFFKLDPIQHLDCVQLKLLRISDVKQHIKRKHSLLQQDCPNCSKSMTLNQQQESIQPKDPEQWCYSINTQGICADKQYRLAQRVPRSMTASQQWYNIWNTVFPGRAHPPDVYLGTVLEEVVGIIRGFWKHEGSPAAENFIDRIQAGNNNEAQVPILLENLIKEVEGRFKLKAAESEISAILSNRSIEYQPVSSTDSENDGTSTCSLYSTSSSIACSTESPIFYYGLGNEGMVAGEDDLFTWETSWSSIHQFSPDAWQMRRQNMEEITRRMGPFNMQDNLLLYNPQSIDNSHHF